MSEDKITYRDIPGELGEMIAGATSDGICFLEWHDRGGVERIKKRVQKRYGMELIQGNSGHIDSLESELTDYFAGKLQRFKTPLDYTGTGFERQIWKLLLSIPYGETRSYGQMADLARRPGAQRAVGRANGANYVSIVIPCHRVIRADGDLCGYGGKLWRKKRLLELESGISGLALD